MSSFNHTAVFNQLHHVINDKEMCFLAGVGVARIISVVAEITCTTTSAKILRHCHGNQADLEFRSAKCRPFDLPQEIPVVVPAVYIPPDANANTTLGHMLPAINKQQNADPDEVFIGANDFNHADLKTTR